MIIKLTGATFSTNIGNISELGQPFTVTVNCSTTGATITLEATGQTTVTSTNGTATMSNVPYGTTVKYTVSATGYVTQSGSVSSSKTITVTLAAVGSGEDTGTTLVELEFANAYINYFNEKSKSVAGSQSNTTESTSYLCCGGFTKEDIPAGSKIIVSSTYSVRMCMWYDPTIKNANGFRGPTINKGTTYEITQGMWDNTDFTNDDSSTSDTTTPFTAIAFNVMGNEGDFVVDNISDVVSEIKKYITIMVPSK